MSNFIVRLTIFYSSFYFMFVLYMAWNGEVYTNDIYRPMVEYCLYILASEHPKYHCRFARFLALNLCYTDAFTILDSYFNLIPDAEVFLYVISSSWVLAVSVTIYLAIRHFIRVKRLRETN